MSEEEALKRCQTLDSSSTLISIHSRDEQQFIDDITAKYHNISTSVWIGLNYGKDNFHWQDQTETNYTNWSDEAAKDGEVKCVEMSLEKETNGKWSDVSCKKSALIICQKKQDLTLITLRNALVTLENKLAQNEHDISCQRNEIDTMTIREKNLTNFMEKQLKSIDSLIPIGFLYTQFPSQSSPDMLWPNMKWTEVTQSYAGLFFRAEGGNSSSYDELQLASAPHLAQINQHVNVYEYGDTLNITLEEGIETKRFFTGKGDFTRGYFSLSFLVSNEEVRPINKAIKIWKRTG